MSQTFPFTNPDPGWADGKKLYASEMIQVSRNAAQAADGLVWSDVAIFKNFSKVTTTAGTGTAQCIFWDGYLKRWINGYTTGGNPGAFWSYDGKEEWTALSVTAGTNWNATAAGASNGAGTVLLGGGGGSATTSKIRQSADGGATWTARSLTASGTEQVSALHWFAAAGLFVAVLNTASSTNIETSPDGITWTQRTGLPNSSFRGAMASSGTTLVVLNPSGASNKSLTSATGVTYAEATMPSSAVWSAVTWSAQLGKFFAIGNGVIASSTDGTTWSASGLVAPFTSSVGGIVSYGRVLIAAGLDNSQHVSVSVDGGATWTPVKVLGAACTGLALGDSQVVCIGTNLAYPSIRGGGL